ncbi:MAG TPA: histidinol dehydrogenase, partial [Arenimonas sp.]|nr:histidinol dehydrogenase [Arenimonas sp.]
NKQFDGVSLTQLAVSEAEFAEADALVSDEIKTALKQAKKRIAKWHKAGMSKSFTVKTAPGVQCGRIIRPIQRVGLYIPAGSAPLPSTVLMLGIPAQLAECLDVIICTPPQKNGQVNPVILYAAKLCGVQNVYKTGGAQAIAAMALGTESIGVCAKIFGPGNSYVSTAKQLVQSMPSGPAIDLPAGPSEVLVIADATSKAEFVAADLLAQAEHGTDSQVVCLCSSKAKLNQIIREIKKQTNNLPRKEIILNALGHARFISCANVAEAIAISNQYAPEHLILSFENAEEALPQIQAAGSVFIGPWSSESLGDYCSGTNHTLPTNGYARSYSGVSVSSFQLNISTQRISQKGLQNIGPCALTLAGCEQLDAHAQSVSIRLAALP